METKSKPKQQLKMLTGNASAAHAARLCKTDVIAGYPITPQTEIWDILYRFQADGLLTSRMVEPESEHSAMSIIIGASAAGARTFTATASQGLFYMYEPYVFAACQRLPLVMVNANRDIEAPATIAGSGQDVLLVKDTGWIQIQVESCQEVLDTIIMAYRLAEDPEILLPVTVSYDGYYLSYFSEAVDIPDQEPVDAFLGEKNTNWHVALDPERPMGVDPLTGGATGNGPALFANYRRGQCNACCGKAGTSSNRHTRS